MAKKKDNENDLDELNDGAETKEKGGNRVIAAIIAFVVVLIWLGFFAVMIRLDVGGFGSGVLRPILKDVPIINKILPPGTDEEYTDENETTYKSLAEAIKRIRELELQLDSLTDVNSVNSDYVKDLEAEVNRLKVFEENQNAFEERVKEFDNNVVFAENAPSLEEYMAYYESIDPDNAAEIYRQVVEQNFYSQKIVNLANKYAKMDPEAAAPILEGMTSGDLDVVCGILDNLKEQQAAAIMAEMDPTTAALITKKLSMRD